MANCSFIKATEARNLARDNTVIWTEICEVQEAVLAAIDANQYSTIVADGTPFTSTSEITAAILAGGGSGYTVIAATAAIDDNGTGGSAATVTPIVTGGVITSFTVGNGGSGYAPVSATALVGDLYETRDDLVAGAGTGQNETHFDNSPTSEGTFTTGQDYRVGEVITLSESSVTTVASIAGLAVVTTVAQNETNFDTLGHQVVDVGGSIGGGSATGLTNDATVYTATVTVDGGGPQAIAITGSAAQTYTTLLSELNTDTTGATWTLLDGDLRCTSSTVAGASAILIADTDLFSTLTTFSSLLTPLNGVNDGTFVGGDGVGGTAYQVGTTITMSDGSVIFVDTVDVNGDVTEFTVLSASTSSFPTTSTLTQVSAQSNGLAFTITTGTNNEISVGTVATFLLRSPGATPFNWPSSITQASTDGIGQGFVLLPDTGNLNVVSAGSSAVLTPIVTNGIITNIVINAAGTGYLAGAPIAISHPSGTGASAIIGIVGGSGQIQSITIVNGGTGYDTVNALVTVTHPNGQDFAGIVLVTAGVVTGVSIQDGGVLYNDVYPYTTISDATGSGANVNVTGVAAGLITSIQLTDGGSGYSQTPSISIFNSDAIQNNTATITLTVGANTYGTNPLEYYSVLAGQATDAVISDQIQYVLDYFTALGYNIRAQVNPATGDTMQWQLIW